MHKVCCTFLTNESGKQVIREAAEWLDLVGAQDMQKFLVLKDSNSRNAGTLLMKSIQYLSTVVSRNFR